MLDPGRCPFIERLQATLAPTEQQTLRLASSHSERRCCARRSAAPHFGPTASSRPARDSRVAATSLHLPAAIAPAECQACAMVGRAAVRGISIRLMLGRISWAISKCVTRTDTGYGRTSSRQSTPRCDIDITEKKIGYSHTPAQLEDNFVNHVMMSSTEGTSASRALTDSEKRNGRLPNAGLEQHLDLCADRQCSWIDLNHVGQYDQPLVEGNVGEHVGLSHPVD